MPGTIHTGGGAYVGENVNAGTFIGRDQIIVINGYSAEQLEQVSAHLRASIASGSAHFQADVPHERIMLATPGQPTITLSADAARDLLAVAVRQGDERAYLDALIVNPRYGRWTTQFVPLAGTLTSVDKPPGWGDIPPEFTLIEMLGEGAQRQTQRTRLEDITEAMARHAALALLGEPGAGKTTTLYKLAWDAAYQRATGRAGPLPLVLPLAEYRVEPSAYAFVEAQWKQRVGTNDLAERLRRGDLLLLFDALNEMPFRDERDYRERLGGLRRFLGEWPGNRAVFSGRSRDYNAIEPLGLPQVEIEPLDDGRVRDFLHKYAPGLADAAWQRLHSSPLLDLVRNPYYLFMLTYILCEGGNWPDNRAGLFDRFVSYLIAREKSRQHPDWLDEWALRQAFAGLAASLQPMGIGTRLPRSEFLQRIPTQVICNGKTVDTPPETVLRLGLEATLLDAERSSDHQEQARFYHHQLQEYFAACALLDDWITGQDMSARWRQPRAAREMPALGKLGDFEPLPPPPSTGWEEPTVLAAGLAADPTSFVQAVQRTNLVLAARCLKESGQPASPTQIASVQQALLREIADLHVHLRARIAAGEALGKLGDPRFQDVTVNGQRVLLPPLVRIPAGEFQMGSSAWQVLWLALRGFSLASDERPRHTLSLPEFYIGQFPVTNAEYACFIEAGGYQQDKYWSTPTARAWRRGELTESGPLAEAMKIWQAVKENPTLIQQMHRSGSSPQTVATWEQLRQMEEVQVREMLGKQYAERPRDRPGFWNDERFNNPSQPVVGVTWYEALAYCTWLDAQRASIREARLPVALPPVPSGYVIRLPTEAEWDRVKISPKHREGGQNSRNLLLLSSECAKGQARQADCQRRPQANLTWLKPNQQASRELHVQTW